MATYPPQTTEPVEPAHPAPAVDALPAPLEQQRRAWLVLWVAFASFLAISAFALFGVKAFVESAMDPRDAVLAAISGTAQVRGPRQAQWTSVGEETRLREGDRLRTDGVSQAFLTLFDRSTVEVFAGVELELTESAIGRFHEDRKSVELTLRSGRVHVGVAPDQSRLFRVTTRNGHTDLREGSYTIAVDAAATRVRVGERGSATMFGAGGVAELSAGARADIDADGPHLLGVGPEDLIYNGDFAQGLQGWRAGHEAGYPAGLDKPGQQALVEEDRRTAVHFMRQGSKATHSETFLVQDLDKDVTEYGDLRLALDLRVRQQSLSGGGYVGTEYPVQVRLTYRSADTETPVVWGFYYQNDDSNRVDGGTLVPQDTWLRHTVPVNLMTLFPPPQRLLSLQVSASGHDYDSFVTNVSLTAQ